MRWKEQGRWREADVNLNPGTPTQGYEAGWWLFFFFFFIGLFPHPGKEAGTFHLLRLLGGSIPRMC